LSFQPNEMELKAELEETPIPEKCISREIQFDVKMKICFIDFEGLADSRSIKHILAQVNPKKLVSKFSFPVGFPRILNRPILFGYRY
jgi:hypothetical protein